MSEPMYTVTTNPRPPGGDYFERFLHAERAVLVLEQEGSNPELTAALRGWLERTRPETLEAPAVNTPDDREATLLSLVRVKPGRTARYYADRASMTLRQVQQALAALEGAGLVERQNLRVFRCVEVS